MSDVVNVTLIARNTADPPLESKQVFSVRINDVNDNDPVFLVSLRMQLRIECWHNVNNAPYCDGRLLLTGLLAKNCSVQ